MKARKQPGKMSSKGVCSCGAIAICRRTQRNPDRIPAKKLHNPTQQPPPNHAPRPANARDDVLRRAPCRAVHRDRPLQHLDRHGQLRLAAPRARAPHALKIGLKGLNAVDDPRDEGLDVAAGVRGARMGDVSARGRLLVQAWRRLLAHAWRDLLHAWVA